MGSTYLDVRLCSEFLSTDIAAEGFSLTVSEHVFPHVSCSSQLLVAYTALMLSASVMSLRKMILIVSLVVKLSLAPFARPNLYHACANFHVGFQVAVADELFTAVLTLKPLPLGEWNVLLEVSHDLEEKLKVLERSQS